MKDGIFDLTDRCIVVTGGSGLLGSAFVKELALRNVNVISVDQIKPANPVETDGDRGTIDYFAANITDKPELQDVCAEVLKKYGRIDGLINSAAIDTRPDAPIEENGPFENFPLDVWRKVIDVNVTGTFLCCQIFGKAMADQKKGSIINICSTYGLVSPDQKIYEYRRQQGEDFYKPPAYATSKSALLNLTRYIATYWGAKGVRTNTLTFGGVENEQDEEFMQAYRNKTPLGRMAKPEDYLGPIIFLLSDASNYMTGSNLVVDGGWTAW
jgi:NAD(P)-dependent dehydrogenase (short-subunit alcohol dehydrogenase family)